VSSIRGKPFSFWKGSGERLAMECNPLFTSYRHSKAQLTSTDCSAYRLSTRG